MKGYEFMILSTPKTHDTRMQNEMSDNDVCKQCIRQHNAYSIQDE